MNDVTLHRKGSSSSLRTLSLAGFKKRFAAFKREWAPLLAAKERWDDEYNFPAGRWAGQGIDPRYAFLKSTTYEGSDKYSWYQRAW